MARQSKAAEATAKQEAFARCFLEGHSATEAYRRAYGADGMKDTSIRVEASRLLRNPKVAAIIEAARMEVMRGLVLSLKEARNRLDIANLAALKAIEKGEASPSDAKLFIDSFDRLRAVSKEAIFSEATRYNLSRADDLYGSYIDNAKVEVLPIDQIIIGGASVEE